MDNWAATAAGAVTATWIGQLRTPVIFEMLMQ